MLLSWPWLLSFLVVYLKICYIAAAAVNPKSSSVTGRHGAVATDNGQCSDIGRDVLKEGGHAVDAAVAAALCLGVISPASSGLGGGAFMIVHSSEGNTYAYDMRETAPLLASQHMYGGNETRKASGPLSIAVPGELMGLEIAWKKYGRMPWYRLVTPSVKLAEDGFPISPYLHMQMMESKFSILADEGLRGVFTSNGTLLKPGDLCHNKKLAETLRIISEGGAKPFYKGPIGIGLIKDIKKFGGILSQNDLANYQVKIREPIVMKAMGVEILSMPPPSSGGAALALILNILAQHKDISNIPNSLLTHREVEALKTAFAIRMNLGDPDFVDVKSVLKDMLSKSFAANLSKTIFDNTTFNSSHYGGRWNQIQDHGTSHISIVDEDRNAVSMTCTINNYFGAKFLSPSTGIVLNNEMADFSMPMNTSADVPPPAPPNFVYPNKRPLSSMTPTIFLKNGNLRGVVGTSGGQLIIAAVTEVLLNHLVRRMDPLSSVLAPRVYHQLIPNVLQYENWTVPTGEHFEVGAEIRDSLTKKGHVLQSLAGGTVCQFIMQHGRQLIAISDPRKGGYPAAF